MAVLQVYRLQVTTGHYGHYRFHGKAPMFADGQDINSQESMNWFWAWIELMLCDKYITLLHWNCKSGIIWCIIHEEAQWLKTLHKSLQGCIRCVRIGRPHMTCLWGPSCKACSIYYHCPTHQPAPMFHPVTSSHTTNLVIFQLHIKTRNVGATM